MNGWHMTTAQCDKGVEWKRWRLTEEEMRESMDRDFQAYGRTLATVTSLKYLSQVMTTADDEWTVVVGKLRKDQKSWAQMASIMVQEGAFSWVLGVLFKAVVQTVLLLGSETWVLITRMGKILGSFQNRVTRKITGRRQN